MPLLQGDSAAVACTGGFWHSVLECWTSYRLWCRSSFRNSTVVTQQRLWGSEVTDPTLQKCVKDCLSSLVINHCECTELCEVITEINHPPLFFFFGLDPLCASPFGPLCNTSGEAGIRGMPCGFMFCMSHSDWDRPPTSKGRMRTLQTCPRYLIKIT